MVNGLNSHNTGLNICINIPVINIKFGNGASLFTSSRIFRIQRDLNGQWTK